MIAHQVFCNYCGYDANDRTDTHCEICNQPLLLDVDLSEQVTAVKPEPQSNFPTRLAAGALALLLIGGGLYILSRSDRSSWLSLPSNSHRNLAKGLRLRNSITEVPNVPSGLFNYGGGFLFAALTAQGFNAAITEAHPDFQLRYTEPINRYPGSGTGIRMLIDKQLSFSQSGRPLRDSELKEAASRGYELEAIPVALDGIAFYTHPDVSIQGLSIAQVQAIFTGKIRNWREVDGPNLPIVLVSIDPKATSSFQILFEGKENATLASNARILRDYTTCIRAVATTPGAISYGSAPLIVTQKTIRPIALSSGKTKEYISPVAEDKANTEAFLNGTYPLTRRLFIIIRQDGSLDEQAGIAYSNFLLSEQGQQMVRDAGFVPLRF